jgi:hypothetical protein
MDQCHTTTAYNTGLTSCQREIDEELGGRGPSISPSFPGSSAVTIQATKVQQYGYHSPPNNLLLADKNKQHIIESDMSELTKMLATNA